MFALRQIIEDPDDFIPVPPEIKHKRTEVIFLISESSSPISKETTTLADLAGSWVGPLEREQGVYEERLALE